MKNKMIFSFSVATLLVLPAVSVAQPMSNQVQNMVASTDTIAHITLFIGVYAEGKTWLHWTVQDQQCDGVYTVYRSFDGETFEVLGEKKGIGVPVSVPIGWYLQDANPSFGTVYYKLVHLGSDQSYLVTKNISVTRPGTLLSEISVH